MNKISWCKEQRRGIRIVETNENLSNHYYKNAEDSLKILKLIRNTQSNMWIATTKYYIEYFAAYSLLMKLGIKCEIHECTIEIIKSLEEENIVKKGTSERLTKDKELRIENQYYLKNKPVDVNFDKLSEYLLSIKRVLDSLNKDKINKIRNKLKNY